MRLIRRQINPNLALQRQAAPADLVTMLPLFRDSAHRFLGLPSAELPALLVSSPAIVLALGNEIIAAAVGGGRHETTAWLRGLALADGLAIGAGLDALLPPFHALMHSRGVQRLFYGGDEIADHWLQPALRDRQYQPETDVIAYEKNRLDTPSPGNVAVRVRRAEAVDLPAALAVDRAAFDPHWRKDEDIIGPSIYTSPCFIVAELDSAIIGYAFVTVHFGGRLIHLVRIAVHPAQQGRGVGARLLAEVTAYARDAGAETLTLNTQADNVGARRLYEWFGFRPTGEQQAVLRFDLTAQGAAS